jgi:hypothetical protein
MSNPATGPACGGTQWQKIQEKGVCIAEPVGLLTVMI